jgi:hypothetical protein
MARIKNDHGKITHAQLFYKIENLLKFNCTKNEFKGYKPNKKILSFRI